MSVPSNSPKYICQTCRHKIGTVDLEEIFQEQLRAFPLPSFETKSETLFDYWQTFTKDDKRTIVEQLVEQIIVGAGDIRIEFGISPNSLKTMVFGQQTEEKSPAEEKEIISSQIIQQEKSQVANLTEPLMNEIEAAKFLGISRMTLLRKRNTGIIKFFRIGFCVLIQRKNIFSPFLKIASAKPKKIEFVKDYDNKLKIDNRTSLR
jgi:hypothetical protein